jgi:hypothetical protein
MINIEDPNTKLTVESSSIIEINRICQIKGYICVDVPYKIVCDLKETPEEYHSIVIQTLLIK